MRVAVALQDLRRHRRDTHAEVAAGVFFDARGDGGVCADRAGHLSDGDRLSRLPQPFFLTRDLVDPHRELEPERGRLRVYAVRATDADRVLVAQRLTADDLAQRGELAQQHIGRRHHLQAGRRVPHVGGGEAQVHPARLRPERVRDGTHECGHVVVRLGDVAVDVSDVDARVLRDQVGVRARDLTRIRPRLHNGDLDLQPPAELGVVRPDRFHLRPAIAWNHSAPSIIGSPHRRKSGCSSRNPRDHRVRAD